MQALPLINSFLTEGKSLNISQPQFPPLQIGMIVCTYVPAVRKKYTLNLKHLGTSLTVQWLGLCLPMQGLRVRSLVGELGSHMPRGQKTKQNIEEKQYCNRFNKDFKNGPHQKIIFKKNVKHLAVIISGMSGNSSIFRNLPIS